jgi:hypothetical protein
MVFKYLLLIAILRLLVATRRPVLCAFLFVACAMGLSLAFGASPSQLLVPAAMLLAGSFVYFGLLAWLDNGLGWWLVALVGGIVLGVV